MSLSWENSIFVFLPNKPGTEKLMNLLKQVCEKLILDLIFRMILTHLVTKHQSKERNHDFIVNNCELEGFITFLSILVL